MRVKTVSVTYERKFGLPNYCSATIGATYWAELDSHEVIDEVGNVTGIVQDENEVEAVRKLFAQAKAEVRAQAMPVIRPELEAIKQQLDGYTFTQDELQGILAGLIANGTVEVKLVK